MRAASPALPKSSRAAQAARLLLAVVPHVVGAAGIALAFTATPANAQDFVGTRALSLSEAYRATATGNDAIYMNPAGLVLIPRYAPEVHYQLALATEEHQVDASVVDSKTSEFAGGIGYTFEGAQFTKRATVQHTATLAMAYPFLEKLLCVGLGLKYVNVWDAFVGNYLNALSADLGVLSRLPGGVTFAAVGYNLIPIRSARVPISAGFAANLDLGPLSSLILGGTPTMADQQNAAGMPMPNTAGGLRGPLDGWTVEVDWFINFATLQGPKSRISVGTEYLAFEMVPLRAGYLYDEKNDDHLVSVGAGFIIPYFGLDVGFQQSVVHPENRTFGTSLKVFIPM